MIKIKKGPYWMMTHANSEPYEEFDRKKIEMALVRAGLRGRDVEQIAAKIKPFEGITTGNVDEVVVKELEKRDPETAKMWKRVRDYRLGRDFLKRRPSA